MNAVKGSKVLAQVDEVAPEWLRAVPKRLSALLDTSGLPAVLQPFGRTPIVEVARRMQCWPPTRWWRPCNRAW
ncbi:hypothetical protein MMUR_65760 [Mycolicibacterium murale]|uniref:Uncharacterized protein n=1 Tax=Mycolicibacterium murale TaxID=182220 RepID=A0A7I9WYI5_9MYCO|nr:hypothetical protein MMUR_65760 [Mycolicibacterium murale]